MANIRRDIAKLGGPWSSTMQWYARAVRELRSRPFNDRTSWVYIAALHGVDQQGWTSQNLLSQNLVMPPQDPLVDRFGQCQHAGWFFLPWHRGYLHALEAILADVIVTLGGPADWALPYWNYLDAANPNARKIPQEFLDPTMPDGSANALADALRGPATTLGPQPWVPTDISLTAQSAESVYTAIPGTLGYGGPISGFAQFGNAYGANEADPHNLVHVMIGGDTSPAPQGWMFDPNFAALDPIFWVHHCNVDRLWSAWLSDTTHVQETGAPWRNGPFPMQFTMPDTAGALWIFVPEDTLPGAPLDPTYDDLTDGTGIVPTPLPLGVAVNSNASPSPPPGGSSALIGASPTGLTVGSAPASAKIQLAGTGILAAAEPDADKAGRERYYLNLEGVKGGSPSVVLSISLSAPNAQLQMDAAQTIKTVALFGLSNATKVDGPHGGGGISATVEITDIVHQLHPVNPSEIAVQISLPEGAAGDEVRVDRVSIYVRQNG